MHWIACVSGSRGNGIVPRLPLLVARWEWRQGVGLGLEMINVDTPIKIHAQTPARVGRRRVAGVKFRIPLYRIAGLPGPKGA